MTPVHPVASISATAAAGGICVHFACKWGTREVQRPGLSCRKHLIYKHLIYKHLI